MVTHQRKSTTGELHPDLMTSAGVKAHMHQTGFPFRQPLEFQPCLLYTAPLTFYHKNLVLFAVLPQKIFPVTGFRRGTMHHGHIFLDHGTFLDGFGKGGSCLLFPGIDHDTAHIFIQPVDGENLSAKLCNQPGGNLCLGIQPHRLDTDSNVGIGKQNFHSMPSFVFLTHSIP